MTEKIQKRIDELTQERDREKQRLIQQAQIQIEREIAPFNASINELKSLIGDELVQAGKAAEPFPMKIFEPGSATPVLTLSSKGILLYEVSKIDFILSKMAEGLAGIKVVKVQAMEPDEANNGNPTDTP